ncbi:MAG: tol-pal system-associated acyl-CoA thioesterase [Arenicellales bacterium]|nr:tol-pal system-associated acyl-CoA thioesterase [Arenicellales bacterium]
MTGAFETSVRVYYEDTDAGGIVYYANYLRFMERCRTDWLRDLGHDISTIGQQFGVFFAVRSTSIEYFKPAQLSDLLTVTVDLQQLRHASLYVDQNIFRNDELLCEGSIRLAALKADTLDPTPIPEPLITDIKRWKMP